MNELRFSCGKCGQHLKADAGCVDQVIQCPVCQANVRIPPGLEAGDDGSLPTAWETASIVTPATTGARATTVSAATAGSGVSGEGAGGGGALAGSAVGAGARGRPGMVLAGLAVAGIVGVSLWLWKPWQTTVSLPPSAPGSLGSGSSAGGSAGSQADELALRVTATDFMEALVSGRPDQAEALATDQAKAGAVRNFVEFLQASTGGEGTLSFTPGPVRVNGEQGTVDFDVRADGEDGTLRLDARKESAGWRVLGVQLEDSTPPGDGQEAMTVTIDFTRHAHPMEAMMGALAQALGEGFQQGMQEALPNGTVGESGEASGKPEIDDGEVEAFASRWTVDFAALSDDARALVDAQLEPLGLGVSPSIYTATTGRKVKLPARVGTRLELIEEVGRQLGWKPVYAGRQLKFERGIRGEPVSFAGPFMLQVIQVTPSTAYATAEVTLRLTGVGIPDALRQSWLSGFKGLTGISAKAPDGADLVNPYADRPGGAPDRGSRLLEAEHAVSLWHAFRGVPRIASLGAELALPGMKPPFDRLQFEFTDVPLKPGPDTPGTERPLAFSGEAPLDARVHSVIPGEPFDRARVDIQNVADRPLRRVVLNLVFRDAGGREIGRTEYTHVGDRDLPGVREKRRLDRVMLAGKPEETALVEVEVAGAVFAGGVEWKRAP